MPFSGSWEIYSAFNKIAFVKAMVNQRLTLRRRYLPDEN